jgi:hypothetical protein
MSIVRQIMRETTLAAFAACRGRLFGGQGNSVYSDRVKGSWATLPITPALEPKYWRGG